MVPWVGLWFVIVAFSGQSNLRYEKTNVCFEFALMSVKVGDMFD